MSIRAQDATAGGYAAGSYDGGPDEAPDLGPPASKFTQVLRDADLGEDYDAVALFANFLLNTVPGYIPSAAARAAVAAYRVDPEQVRGRVSGQPLGQRRSPGGPAIVRDVGGLSTAEGRELQSAQRVAQRAQMERQR